ncbi:LPD23 domain-containing protein [Helicobacter zhangjianzhongii]|uniref:ADP-ribosyltransferase-containing protein n=1 Tax=Helicobacter zhangjianzhongii TaxID=2974574 RepID=UPI0025553BDC|nr:LPD23 domain-containing protein [Helicobacter sp. CPD2-1]MDL0081048.1 PBECR2 nuclease fold domain-containing protein [Helicobacter sp. CPD2-1]
MYCLEKLQRELAYFFDMDLRELPRVQELLTAKGYTQVQKGDEIIKLEPSTPNQKTPYTDTQGHTHQIPTDIAQKWLESFGLKDLQESYTPKFSEQVAQALEPILQGEQITLSANSLVKLIQRDRAEFLPYIKDTLETPNAVVRQVDGAIIFAKDYRDEKLGKFFASVSKNDNGEWVISSNAPKNLNNLQNKIKEGGEVLYSDLPELPIIARPDLTAKALNSEANLSDIIPHTAQEKPKWSKADQKAWKAAKLAETRAKAQELQAKLQPIYDEVRPIIIEAQNIAKTKNLEKNAAAKEKYDELHKKARQIATPKLEQFYPELEKHGLETSLKDFFRHPETAQIQVTPMQNSNLKWKNKERGEQGLKGSAKYREQALEKLSEKSYIDRLEPATKAENPLTQLHGLKYEILKDLHKAKRYAKQGDRLFENPTIDSTTKTFNQADIKLESLDDFASYARLAETKAKAQELQAKLQPIYDEVRPLVIQARKLEKPYKEEGKKLPPKVEKQVNELLAKVSESITPKQKPFEAELEKHGLQLNRTDFLHYPESGSIQVTPKQNSNLKWKNKERGEQGLKGSAKYREQALEKLSEKSYIDRLEPATKAENPLTQLHGLKYEILKDLHKAKRYAKQGGTSYETYTRYASRASDELDIIEQAIRELKNAIVPKPKRAEQVRSKVQDFIKWRDEVRFDVDYLLGLESDGTRHALEYLRDLPTPTKHHASFVKDLQEQIHKHFDTDPTPPTPPSTPTPADTPKVDSSEIKELSTKTTSKLTKEQLEALPLATPQEYGEFLEKIAQKDYQNAPEILKIATLNNNLQELINNNHSAGVFITRARVGHISEARKSEYGQALTLEEQKQIPEVIAQAKEAYADDKSGFIIPFADKNNGEKINLIILDSDNKGNFLITAKKVNSAELSNPKYKKLARAGVEPATTTPPLKTEQKPTEAISPASDEIIPQTQISNIKKQLVELKESKSAYEKYLKSLERNMKDVELEERYSRGEERIKVFERKRLIQSSIDEHTQGLNAVLKKMIELHKQLPENVRYTKEVLDDLTKIEAILKGNNYSLEQALRLSKITQRLQEKAIIESESFLNKVYNLDDFAKGAKSLQGTSYAYNTDESIKRYFKTIAEMIDSIPAFKISANQLTTPQETLPAGVKTRVNNLMTKINDLYNAASIISHDKLQAQIKSIKDPQVLRAFLQRLDETYTEPKGFIKLSRDLAQKNLEAYSDPQVQEILAVLGGASKPRDKTKVRELYHRYGTPELKGLFDKVLDIVGDIPFEIKKIPTKLGNYNLTHHTIALDEKLLLDKNIDRFMQTLLHELIHSTIARAQYHLLSPKNYPDLASKLTPAQKAAVKEIDDLYILAFKTHQAQKRAKTLGDDEQRFYGFTNSKEFVAELANPKFRSYLEKQNIFKRVLNAIIKFFTGGEGEQTTILKALQESYEKYLDSFGESSESFFAKATQTTHAQKSDDLVLFDRDSSAPNFTYTTGEAKGIAELRKDLKQALEPYKSTPITNKETGLQGVVTDTERNKISSKKAVDKSIANGFTRDEHFAAAQDLKNLFENATKAQSHNDYKQRENIAQVHRFVKDLYINDKQAQAKITLFEKIEGKNRIYTLELESLSPTPQSSPHTQAGVAVEAQVTRDVVRPNANIAKTDGESIAQDSNALLESTMKSFKYDERKAKDLLEWHKDSHPLTKDENGVPKVFYHGTSADELFEVFSPRKDSTKWGFWFASGEDYADHYGKGKYEARQEPLKFSTFLKVKNPFDMTDDKNLEVLKKIMGKKEYEAAAKEVDFDHDNGASKIYRILSYSPFDRYKDKARAFQNKLKKLGYDGIKEQDGVMVVFEPNQIKHVKDLQEQIHKHFDTDPTPPTPPSTPTPADTPKVDSSGESTQTPKEAPKLESNLNHTLESYKAHETATTKLKHSIFEKENELKDLVAEKEKVEQRAETIKAQAHSRTLTKIAGELEEIGFDTFSKRPVLDYEAPRIKKINPRLDGQEFYDESTIIKFKDLKKFIKSRDDFIKFKNKLDTLYLVDRPYGSARYLNKIKDFSDIKQARFYQAFSESNYDNIKKELIDKEASKVKNIDNDKIISLQKELNELKEQLEKTNQSLAHSQRELEQIPFLQKLFNNKPLFNDFLALRFNTMSEKELKKEAQKALIDIDISRSYFEKALNITPIKDFGTNYAEHYHSGESAIAKLLLERQGQVAGAFHRDELGDIDLVWGEVTGSGQQAKGWGLAKIIEKHGDEFQDIAKELDEIIRDGEVVKRVGRDEAYNIEYNGFKVGINKGFNKQGENKWIVTAFDDNVEKTAKTAPASDSTKETDLSLNSSDIVAQDLQDTPKVDSNALLKSAMKKFAYDEKKAKDLLEWHKDSSPLTKDENGVPKVFYHGTSSDKVFEVFNKDKIHSGYGFWFGDDIADRAVKENTTGKAPIIKAFLQMKKPFIFSNQGITAQNIDEYAYITGISKKRITELYEAKEAFNTLEKMIQRDTQADYVWAGAVDYFEIEKGGKELNIFDYRQLDLSDQTIAFLDRMRTKGITARGIDINPTRQYESAQEARETLERLKEKGYDSMVYANSEFVVFDSNQIKHIENRGVAGRYFYSSSPNIFHSNPHAGAGLLGGSVAGVEQDENGNITFSPEKFALGFLGGAAGSKAVAKGLEWRANKVAKSYPNIAKDNPTLMQEIAKRDLQTYAMTNTHNALTRFLNNNKLLDVNPKLFAGEKALVNEAYAPHKAKLERAKELESSGADEIEIWEKTGWYKDKDQRWKFEISQSGGELYTKDEYGRPYKREFLHKILKDDELFNAYPKLRDLRVIEDKKLGLGVSASYDPKLKDIYIKNLQAKEAKISLYHEIQHAIQDIEGFAY